MTQGRREFAALWLTSNTRPNAHRHLVSDNRGSLICRFINGISVYVDLERSQPAKKDILASRLN